MIDLANARAALEELVRLPSVSADPRADLRPCAAATAALLVEAGLPDVEIIDDIPGGRPAVIAHHPAPPGQPTVLLYAHYDVQPAGDLTTWTSPPFEPVERSGRLYGRGTADDKAGIVAHLAAIRAHGGKPPVGVTVLVEGEEEISSPTLDTLLFRLRGRLEADVIVLADAENLEQGTPAFTTSLRGNTACTVELRTLETSVHSGSYGGVAPDALTALCRLLATLHDARGDVAVPGLGREVAPPYHYPASRLRAEATVLDGVELYGTGTIAERLWAKPAVSVLAIDACRVENAANALAPVARAKVGLRIAPGGDAAAAGAELAAHLTAHAPWGAQVTVTTADVAQPYRVETSSSHFAAAERAYRTAYGKDCVRIGSGASLPIVAVFAKAFPTATVLITSAGADNLSRPHTNDESISLAEFERACRAEALLLSLLENTGGGHTMPAAEASTPTDTGIFAPTRE